MAEKAPPSNRSFGLLFTAVFAVVSVSLWRHQSAWLPVPAALAAGFLLSAFFWPSVLEPLKAAWMRLADVLHRITSPIVLGVLFLVVFAPVGLAMRLWKRDALRRRFDAALPSYWIPRTPPGPPPPSLRNQY